MSVLIEGDWSGVVADPEAAFCPIEGRLVGVRKDERGQLTAVLDVPSGAPRGATLVMIPLAESATVTLTLVRPYEEAADA